MTTVVGVVLVVGGVAVAIATVVRALPRIANIRTPATDRAKVRELALKERLLLERMIRGLQARWSDRIRGMQATFRGWGGRLRQMYHHLRIRSQEYTVVHPAAAPMTCASALREAQEAMSAEEFERAEERFLACLKMDPKHRDAYLGLSDMYRRRHEPILAEETIRFLRRLCPQDAEVAFIAASMFHEFEKPGDALREITAALRLEPRSPKYLDFGIELAMVNRRKPDATRWLEQLREVNPENQKLGELTERIDAIGRS